jgi:hypothetical protein
MNVKDVLRIAHCVTIQLSAMNAHKDTI